MAIVITFAGSSIVRPGAYSRTLIASGAAAQAQLGIVALIGESTSGPQFQTGNLAASTFSPTQFQTIVDTYGSGELVDMAKLCLNASADPQISGGAQQLILVKTNPGATAELETIAGYTYTFAVTATTLATPAGSVYINTITGNLFTVSTTAAPSATTIVALGGNPPAATGTLTKVSGTGDATIAYSTYVASAPTTYGTLLALDPGVNGNLINTAITTIAGQVVITVTDAGQGITEVSSPIGGNADMILTATATPGLTAATVTTTATTLTTTITGGTQSPLSIQLSQFETINQLANYIASIPGYTCTVPNPTNGNLSPSVMDLVAGVSIFTAYTFVQNAYDVSQYFQGSTLVSFTPTATFGLPVNMNTTYLAGGTLGGTSAADVQAAIDALQGVQCNFIVPCFSQNATADIPTGFTDPTSTYTIAGIIAGLRAHVAAMSSVTGRKERQGFVGYRDTFVNQLTAASTFTYPRIQMHIAEFNVQVASGATGWKQPHSSAVAAAGMKAAAVVGLPNTFKQPNILAFRSPFGDFDPEINGDEALLGNLTFVENNPNGGFRYVLDNSTYAQTLDAWFYARPSVIYAADTAARTIRLNTETFVGQRNSDISPETIKNLLIKVMSSLLASGITVADATSGGKGYTVLNVQIIGSIVYVDVTLVIVEGIEFILNTITVQQANS
jgi:hypothetical protein